MIVLLSTNFILFFILGLFLLLLTAVITLIFYYVRYVRQSSEEKKFIYTILNEQAKKNSIVFLGDSLTDFYRTNEFFLNADIYNRGIAGNTTDDVLERLQDNVLNIEPRKLFLQIGTNDLGKRKSVNYILNNIEKIIDHIKLSCPNTLIYIISLYPINSTAIPLSKTSTGPRKNTDIDVINKMLEQLCITKDISYIDVASHLKDKKGNLSKEYTVEGLHISLLGYAKITEILKPFVY